MMLVDWSALKREPVVFAQLKKSLAVLLMIPPLQVLAGKPEYLTKFRSAGFQEKFAGNQFARLTGQRPLAKAGPEYPMKKRFPVLSGFEKQQPLVKIESGCRRRQ